VSLFGQRCMHIADKAMIFLQNSNWHDTNIDSRGQDTTVTRTKSYILQVRGPPFQDTVNPVYKA
jgi:hypothetical protein